MSNKMLKAGVKKTKSGRRLASTKALLPVLFMLGLLASLLIVVFDKNQVDLAPSANDVKQCLRTEISSSDCQFYLQTANTDQSRSQGLSGRLSMPSNEGMVFVFDNQQKQCFWMKDMNFPLDIVWLNSAKEVVKIDSNLLPDTYPKQFCADTQYVIELNSGKAGNLQVGQKLVF